MATQTQAKLALALHRMGALKFGNFTLKSGIQSPFYIDLRLLVSAPSVLEMAAQALAALASDLRYDRIAAIPMAGLPIGVALSLQTGKPLIYPRGERKTYGTAKVIEGDFHPGEQVLLVDDVITRGDSKLDAMAPLEAAGLNIEDIVVVLDRESGGVAMLADHGYTVHTVLTMTALIEVLADANRITEGERQTVQAWLATNG
jgi:uridine monophosphate synthetase